MENNPELKVYSYKLPSTNFTDLLKEGYRIWTKDRPEFRKSEDDLELWAKETIASKKYEDGGINWLYKVWIAPQFGVEPGIVGRFDEEGISLPKPLIDKVALRTDLTNFTKIKEIVFCAN